LASLRSASVGPGDPIRPARATPEHPGLASPTDRRAGRGQKKRPRRALPEAHRGRV